MIPVVDGHNDALLRVWRSGESLREHGGGHLDLPRMREGGIAAGFFAIFVPEDDLEDDPRSKLVPTEDVVMRSPCRRTNAHRRPTPRGPGRTLGSSP